MLGAVPPLTGARSATLVLAAVALLLWLSAFALREPWAVGWATAALIAEFAVWLSTSSGAAVYAPLFGAALLLQAELAHLVLELPSKGRVETRVLRLRAAPAGLSALLGAALGALLIALGEVDVAPSLALTIVGAAAVAGVAGVLAWLRGRA